MFFITSFVAAFVGLALATLAMWMPDTGVNGSLGAFLTVLGAVGVVLALSVIAVGVRSNSLHAVLVTLMIVAATLTALASWFLMQTGIIVAMVVAVSAFLASGTQPQRRVIR